MGIVMVGSEDGSNERGFSCVVSSMGICSSGEEEGDEVGSREGAGPVEGGVTVGIDNEVGIEGI